MEEIMLNTINWKTKSLKVTSICLDEDNIRLEHARASQDAIVQDLFSNYKTFDLVKSILQFGLFTHELPIVVSENSKQVVLEGNRRVAALKSIINPKLVPKYENSIRDLINQAGDISSLSSIEVKIADSRDSASRVIATIHTVRSRIPWRPLRQAYFYFAQIETGNKTLDQLRLEYPDVDIPRFVRMWEMHKIATSIKFDSKETQSKVNSHNFPITTFERVYNNEPFRTKAGLTFDTDGKPIVEADKEEFLKLIKRLLTDIADKNIDSRLLNRMDSQAAQDYLNSLDNPKKSNVKIGADDFVRETPPPVKRIKLVPADIECTLKYPAIQKMLRELKQIPQGKYPNATHDLLRSFLECSLKAYFETIGQKYGKHLPELLKNAISHFENENKQLVQLLKTIQGQHSNYLYSIDYLNALNHNHNVFSIGENVENAWDQMEPVLRFILNPR